jgi:hypothetical protein
VREVLTLYDPCSYFVVAIFAYLVARRAEQKLPRYGRVMWWVGFVVLLGVAGEGYVEVRPATSYEVFAIVLVAVIAASGASLAAAVALPPLVEVWERWRKFGADIEQEARARALEKARVEEQRRRDEERRREREERAREDEYRRSLPQPPPPPTPTRSDRIAAAKRKYGELLADLEAAGLNELELAAARERARQLYLTDLDQAMQ